MMSPGGIVGGSLVLQPGHGIAGAPHLHARGEGSKSEGTSLCASQTQNVSSQRAHFGVITITPSHDPPPSGRYNISLDTTALHKGTFATACEFLARARGE